MIPVKNRKTINRLSWQTLKTYGSRNAIAILAIVLTTMLFTALLTVGSTMYETIQESVFRQVGGSFHGGFKELTEEELTELRADRRIRKSGARMGVGMLEEAPFDKQYTEVSYMDDVYAEYSFCGIEEGNAPQGEWEIACDTKVLELLGIPPRVGAKVPLTITLGYATDQSREVSGEFVLSGWWTFDPAGTAANVRVSRSCAENILKGYQPERMGDFSGRWSLSVFLASAGNIREKMQKILTDHGYQSSVREEEGYVDIGVNNGYLSGRDGAGDVSGIAVLLFFLLIVLLAGYLIIYNIFQISVSNDIRFYGLLKTIGTTPRQIRQMIRRQAGTLSVLGIPAGLFFGWFIGAWMAPLLQKLGFTVQITKISVDYRIFLFATVFSLVTVFLSCRKPEQLAAKVSPVEAVRYTDVQIYDKRKTGAKSGGTPIGMAWANLSRNRKRTAFIVLSLSLATILFQTVYVIGSGFDMDKFLKNFVISDFVVGDSNYINHNWDNGGLTEEDAEAIRATGYVKESGITWTQEGAYASVPESFYRYFWKSIYTEETIREQMQNLRQEDGGYSQVIGLYGVDDFSIEKLNLLEGKLDGLTDSSGYAIAAVYQTEDNGEVIPESNYVKMGDKVTVRYVETWMSCAVSDGRILTDEETKMMNPEEYYVTPERYHDVIYTVEALVTMPRAMSGRGISGAEFILGTDTLKRDGRDPGCLNFLCDVREGKSKEMTEFLTDYTKNVAPQLDFESRESLQQTFEGGKNAVLLMGGVLSGLLAVVGILNFLNGEITSILSRKRELATLRAVGMTGRQMKQMLAAEGIFHALLAGGLSLLLGLTINVLLATGAEKMLWFFTFHRNMWPVVAAEAAYLLLGALIPILVIRKTEKETIVERLREE